MIFFGTLISMGNECQRRAIDDLREQMMLWVMQDLRLNAKAWLVMAMWMIRWAGLKRLLPKFLGMT